MSRRLIATAVFALCFGWLVVTAADGQSNRRARVSRPSHGPSSRIGRTGGLYTRQFGDIGTLGGMAGGGIGRRGLMRPNYFGAAGRMRRLPPTPMPQALTFAPLGYSARRAPWPSLAATRGATGGALARISRMAAAQRFSVPLTGLRPSYIRLADRPYYVPTPQGTAFHEFFELTPTQAEPASETAIPVEGLVGLLEQENENVFRRIESQALEAFKAATRDAEGGSELLSTAQQQLITVRDLDRQAYLPSLLLVHTALEKSQLRLAMYYLADVVQRHPAVFVERPDLASYYGDAEWLEDKQRWRSALLERRMRKHLRIGDENPGLPSGYLLQAYCAWVLNDRTRVRHALDQMLAAEQKEAVGAQIIAVRYALAAAVK